MKISKIVFLFFIAAFLMTGCMDHFLEAAGDNVTLGNAARGNVIITIGAAGAGRTLRPDDIQDLTVFDYITLEFDNSEDDPDTERFEKVELSGTFTYQTELEVKEWTITVKGFINIGGTDYEAANGQALVDVTSAGAVQNIDLLTGVLDGLPGVFSYDITFPEEITLTSAFLEITPFDVYVDYGSLGKVFDVEDLTVEGNEKGSEKLDPGYYYLRIKAVGNGKTVSSSQIVHIYSGRETVASPVFTETQFTDTVRLLDGTATITGTNKIGETLYVQTGSITGVGGHTGFTYEWQRDNGTIPVALRQGENYTIRGADVGGILRCVVTHPNADGEIIAIFTEAVPYTIVLHVTGATGTDSLTLSQDTGLVGDTITLSYTVANADVRNRLTFSGVDIEQIGEAGSGDTSYTVNAGDAVGGVITINATFQHSEHEFDDIAFDDNHAVEKIYGEEPFDKPITDEGEGSGTITYSSDNEDVATVDANGTVTIHAAGTAWITAEKPSDGIYADATATYQLIVAQRPVTITGLYADNKEYNGLTTADVLGTAVLEGRLDGDAATLTLNHGTASFVSRNVGNGITVNFSGYSLGGNSAPNYILEGQPTSVTANITALILTISDPASYVVLTRAYNGTATAAFNAGFDLNTLIENLQSNAVGTPDTVNLAGTLLFDSPNVADADSIEITFSISGTHAGNYLPPLPRTIDEGVSITKATGAVLTPAGAMPPPSSITHDSITVTALTVAAPLLGITEYQQVAEYAVSTTNVTPTTGWQTGLIFSGLAPKTPYYIFARSQENANYFAGEVRTSTTPVPTSAEEGALDLTFTITSNVDDQIISFTNNPASLSVNAGESITIAVAGTYTGYTWYVGGAEITSAKNQSSLTLNGINYTQGTYQITVIVNSGSVPYSRIITLTVVD